MKIVATILACLLLVSVVCGQYWPYNPWMSSMVRPMVVNPMYRPIYNPWVFNMWNQLNDDNDDGIFGNRQNLMWMSD
ncbi:hypothetical protein SNE40_017937 [Patella caerulea]|uniref:Uncharacterized protein n=1 Tax=Patella caerulea TaxID=87958 RepID=A0AAN8JC26_PATCE